MFDDITGYYLDDIVKFRGYHNRGCGSALFAEPARRLKEKDIVYIELNSVRDEQHKHFYEKNGSYEAGNFKVMGKFF